LKFLKEQRRVGKYVPRFFWTRWLKEAPGDGDAEVVDAFAFYGHTKEAETSEEDETSEETSEELDRSYSMLFTHYVQTLSLENPFTHNTLRGTHKENSLVCVLREILPPAVVITSGQIIGCDRQLDIILVKPGYPVLHCFNGSRDSFVYPESVIAVIEVKSHFQSGDLSPIAGAANDVYRSVPHVPYVVVAIKSSRRFNTLGKDFGKGELQKVAAIFCFQKHIGSWRYYIEKGKEVILPSDTLEHPKANYVLGNDGSAAFQLMLLQHFLLAHTEYPDVGRKYLFSVGSQAVNVFFRPTRTRRVMRGGKIRRNYSQ